MEPTVCTFSGGLALLWGRNQDPASQREEAGPEGEEGAHRRARQTPAPRLPPNSDCPRREGKRAQPPSAPLWPGRDQARGPALDTWTRVAHCHNGTRPEQGLEPFYQGPRIDSLAWPATPAPSRLHGSAVRHVNRGAWLAANKTLFTTTDERPVPGEEALASLTPPHPRALLSLGDQLPRA